MNRFRSQTPEEELIDRLRTMLSTTTDGAVTGRQIADAIFEFTKDRGKWLEILKRACQDESGFQLVKKSRDNSAYLAAVKLAANILATAPVSATSSSPAQKKA